VATAFYGVCKIDPERVRRPFAPVYHFLRNKWWFDELYWAVFVRPAMRISGWIAALDLRGIDRLVDGLAEQVRRASVLDDWIDRTFVDRTVDRIAAWVHAAGLWLRTFQTGRLRNYVMLVAAGTVGVFVIVSVYWQFVLAGALGGGH
jgi:NADH:ubiquinone oxidoreductase subunit 5 (subunit L)/multisubunit Na+/H+ antiporter MnhA subunit